jgi:hypothetical protein
MNARQRKRQAVVVAALRPALDDAFPANGPCGVCGDTTLGQRHRRIDVIAERIRAGEPWESVIADYDWYREGYTAEHAILALAVTSC